jgi:hypothetical protein
MTKRDYRKGTTIDSETAKTLIHRIAQLSLAMDKMNIAEYIEFLKNPRRIILVNFLGGLARGFGIGIGATILAALFIIILSRIVQLNIPLIGEFVAEVVKIVNSQMKLR